MCGVPRLPNCVLCSAATEDVIHLFLECPYVQMTISRRGFQPPSGVFGATTMFFRGITSLLTLPVCLTPFVTTIADKCFGIGVCFRDNSDTLVLVRTLCLPHVVPAIESSTFLIAVQIALKSGYAQVNFESDSQYVVNAITNDDVYVNEPDTVLTNCKSLISSNASYNLAFIRREANRVAHNLARASILQSSPR
ncbi:replication protein A 70 kDa dna-binding subunit, partial [Trifolium medium]|nr:replication protein A 70 kDa dna-binding subunit [Trifolium medium]